MAHIYSGSEANLVDAERDNYTEISSDVFPGGGCG